MKSQTTCRFSWRRLPIRDRLTPNLQASYLTVPNLLTVSRIPLAFSIYLTFNSWLKYPLLAALILSDGLDGYVARKLDQTTEFGALLDPTVDKITAVILFVTIFPLTELSYAYAPLFFARDIFVISLVILIPFVDFDRSALKAKLSGKVVTNLQFLSFLFLIASMQPLLRAGIWLTGAASFWAIADYSILATEKIKGVDIRNNIKRKAAIYGSSFGVFVLSLLAFR